MKRFLPVAVVLLCASQGIAGGPLGDLKFFDDTFEAGGMIRLRYESKDDFNFDEADDDFILSRVRVHLKWTPNDIFTGFLELQDARIYNQNLVDKDAVPNVFADSLDLHQAWAAFHLQPGGVPLTIKVGRQKLGFGAERLVGPLEWVNTARIWDAVRLTLGTEKERTVDIFSARIVPPDNDNPNDWGKTGNRHWDSDFHGIYYQDWQLIPESKFEAYWLLRHNDDAEDEVHTLGVRVASNLGAWDLEAEVMGQFGEYGDKDHEAFAAHAEAGYTAESLKDTRFAVAYNYGSGDSDPDDGDHETFDNLFPTNHAYYGYMDFFSLQNMHSGEFQFKSTFWRELTGRAAFHAYWLAETEDAWYNAGGGKFRTAAPGDDPDSYAGSEIDLTLKYPFLEKHLWFEGGYSHFFTGDYAEDTGADDDADFFYFQSTFTF